MAVVKFNSHTGEHAVLSNFDCTPFRIRFKAGTYTFRNAEAAFQACKYLPLGPEVLEKYSRMSPKEARNAGRKAPLREDWSQARVAAMRHVLKEKFSDPKLREALMKYPVDTTFVHIAPWDRFWGSGADNKGANMMGCLLGQIRKELG